MKSKNAVLNGSPSHLLKRCQQYAADLFAEEADGHDLTPRQLTVLVALEAAGEATQTDLVAATGIDRSTLADMIQRMAAKDLVARKKLPSDARANAVRLSPKGARALKATLGAMKKTDSRLLGALPASKRAEFLRLLGLIAAQAGSDA